MPNLLFSICSELVSLDRITNNISIFNVLEDFTSNKFPFVFPRLFITTLWQRKSDEKNIEFEARIKFTNPKKESIKKIMANWQFTKLRHRHIALVLNLKFDIPGTYNFEIYLRKKDEKEWGKSIFKIPLVAKKAIVNDKKNIH